MFGCSSSSSNYKEKSDPYVDGYAFRQQKDTNPDSDTYGDTKWVRYSEWDNKCKALEVEGYPTIYIDPSTGETIEDNTIEKIGVGNDWRINGPKQKELPTGTVVLQVGSNVTEAHYISVKDGTIPKEIFKYAAKLTNLDSVFKDSSVSNIPEGLFDNNTAVTNFSSAFDGCSSLTSIPDGLFDNNTAVTSFEGTFEGCSSLTSIPEGLFDNNTAVTSFEGTFEGCSSLTSIPEGLFGNNNAVLKFWCTFNRCPNLTSIPKGLFDNNTAVTSFEGTFEGCSSLTSIPKGLFDNNIAVTNFEATFHNCKNLTGSTPTVTVKDGNRYKLWELAGKPGYAKEIRGTGCFHGCTQLDDYYSIPTKWKDNPN